MKLTKTGAGVAAAVVLAGGIAVATTTSAFAASHGSGKAASATAHGKGGGKGGKKAGGRDRLLGAVQATHGERTVTGKDGKTVVHQWQVGKVTAVGGASLTVLSTDGTSWIWTESAQTRTRGQGQDTTVKVGDEVLVSGVAAGAAHDARAVLDPGAAKIARWESRVKGAQPGRGARHQGGGTRPGGQAGAPDSA